MLEGSVSTGWCYWITFKSSCSSEALQSFRNHMLYRLCVAFCLYYCTVCILGHESCLQQPGTICTYSVSVSLSLVSLSLSVKKKKQSVGMCQCINFSRRISSSNHRLLASKSCFLSKKMHACLFACTHAHNTICAQIKTQIGLPLADWMKTDWIIQCCDIISNHQ